MEHFDDQQQPKITIQRDGATESIWQKNIEPLKNKIAHHDHSKIYDVIIVGAGITGITTGLLLQKEGLEVLIAEAHNVGFGTTGGTTAHINSFLDTHYYQLEDKFGEENTQKVKQAVKRAMNLIAQNVAQYNIKCDHSVLPGYIFAQNEEEADELEKISGGFEKVGIPIKWVDSIPVKIPFIKAIEIPEQAQFNPTQYVYALAQKFLNLGGSLLENTRITDAENNDGIITTLSGEQTFKAKNLIYATHIPPGINLMDFRNAPYRSYAISVKLEGNADYPDALVYDQKEPYHYFRTYTLNGEKLMIVGGEDHKTAHENNTNERFHSLENYIKQYYPNAKVVYQWSSQFYKPTDGLPYIGHLIGQPDNVFVATGYSGVGMINSHIAASLLTDIILKRESEYEDLFSPSRVKPIAGFKRFVKEGADVVGELVDTILPDEKMESRSELNINEGRVVNYNGKTAAIYKDDKGILHAVDPLCTHIKCTVSWNKAEKSWDCPCHGSRFSMNGEVLTGPAQKNLEKINLNPPAGRAGSDNT